MGADLLVLAKSKMSLYIEVTKKLVWSDNEDQALTLRRLITTVPAVEDHKVRHKAKSKPLRIKIPKPRMASERR